MSETKSAEEKIEHLGGGYYRLSDGSKTEKRGKENAIAKQKELDRAKADAYEDIQLADGVVIEVDSWNNRKNYHCPVCPYADLKLARLKAHVLDAHTPKERKEGSIIQTDRYGNELNS